MGHALYRRAAHCQSVCQNLARFVLDESAWLLNDLVRRVQVLLSLHFHRTGVHLGIPVDRDQ